MAFKKLTANIALPQIWADGSKINITLLLFFSFRWTDFQLAFVVRGKIRSFNKQHHPADTASNAQPAAMPPLGVTLLEPYVFRYSQ